MSSKSLVLLLAVLGLALVAVTSAVSGVAPRPASPAGGERLPVRCIAEWDLEQGWTQLDLRVPDSPSYLGNPSGFDPFVTTTGSAVFKAGGRFAITCAGRAALPLGGAPWRAAGFACRVYRGGTGYGSNGAKLYTGRGRVHVATDGHVEIGCAGSFNRIVSSPAD